MKLKTFIIILTIVIVGVAGIYLLVERPVCIFGPSEDIGNTLEKMDLIRVDTPRPNGLIESPLTISGEARGYWFFEADFPVILTDWDGRIIAEEPVAAQGEWMTEEFVSFAAILNFDKPYDESEDVPEFMKRGTIIFQKDNPSGLPENDDALEFTIFFE